MHTKWEVLQTYEIHEYSNLTLEKDPFGFYHVVIKNDLNHLEYFLTKVEKSEVAQRFFECIKEAYESKLK